MSEHETQHRDGIAWLDAHRPRRWHLCVAQTTGWLNVFTRVERCACGAIRYNGRGWLAKNSRTKPIKTQRAAVPGRPEPDKYVPAPATPPDQVPNVGIGNAVRASDPLTVERLETLLGINLAPWQREIAARALRGDTTDVFLPRGRKS